MTTNSQNKKLDDLKISNDSISIYQEKALLYANQGQYDKAIKIERDVVAYYKSRGQKINYLLSLSTLAAIFSDAGEFEQALDLGNQVLSLYYDDSINLDTEGEYEIFQHLAIFYENVGNHEKAQEYGNMALMLAKQMPNNPWAYPRSLTFLAYSYSELGDYQKAINLCSEAKKIFEDNNNENAEDYYHILNDLGAYYCGIEDIPNAIDYGWQCINYIKRNSGMEHPQYVIALNNLARYYAINKESGYAIELSTAALDILEKHFPENSFLKGRTYEHLSTFYANGGDYENAVKYCEIALSYFQRIWSKERPGLANEYRKHLQYSYMNSRFSLSEDEIIMVEDIISNIVLVAFSYLPSSGRNQYWKNYSPWFTNELPLYVNTFQTDSLIAYGYNSILLSKGILLNTEVEIRQLIESVNDSFLLEKYLNLQKQYMSIINASNESIINDTIFESLKNEELQLIKSCKKFGDYTKRLKICWTDVKSALNDDEIAIEFSKIRTNDNQTVYVAYTLRNTYDYPHYYELFEEDVIEEYNYQNLYSTIWKPLEKEMKGVNTIFFAPDGELYKIPIETAYYSMDKTMSDKYNMYRLSSTREIANKQNGLNLNNLAAFFGGIDYYATVDEIRKANDNNNLHKSLAISSNLQYSSIERSEICMLEGSKEEILKVSQIPSFNNALIYIGAEGTEEAFKALSGKNIELLHLSTHGFYWPDYLNKGNNTFYKNSISYLEEDEALSRSGLYLAGVNSLLLLGKQSPNMEDGVLTANEVARTDFSNLDLVVLSACETGLGDLKGDGIFGLQRGFKKAGAKAILMSLWKVNDYATQLLMIEFYRNLVSGKSKHESLSNAQRYIREYTDDEGNKLFDSPYYWASFILLDANN